MAANGPPEDVKERLRASYNAMAPEYNAWTARHHSLRLSYLDRLIQACPELTSADQDQSFLELGCGSGQPFLETILARAPRLRVHANDLSEGQLDLARAGLAAYSDRVEYHPGDMTLLDFPEGSLMAVAALYSVIHLPREEQPVMLRRIASWLRPGGALLINFGGEETSGVVFENWLHDKGWMFWSGLGKQGTLDALEKEAGLSVETVELEGDSEEKFLWVIAKKPAV